MTYRQRVEVERKGEWTVERKGELSNGRASRLWMDMGVAQAMWRGQPLINNARKMPSAERVLRALLRALVLEAGKI